MYSGISGMKAFQTKLDVVGNNIANVNTSGYKKSVISFKDMMSQTMTGSQAPVANAMGNPIRGGINPSQVGLGTTVGSIDTVHTQGNRQTTNRPLDLALEGDGMFVLAEGNGTAITGSNIDETIASISFTRAGNFYLDSQGYIVNSSGKYLMGETTSVSTADYIRIQIPGDAKSFSVGKDGSVNYVDSTGTAQIAGYIKLAKFSNPGGLEKIGGSEYQLTSNAGLTDSTGAVVQAISTLYPAGQNGAAQIVAGALEMSNVDLSEEFTEMITAQRAFQANTRIITTSDEILQELVNLKR